MMDFRQYPHISALWQHAPDIIFCVVLALILLRYLVSLWPHSGQATPPLFGDYEAQRHWMEVTTNLPIGDWYRETSDNSLQYWGLDYPPLTAYVSWAFGCAAERLVPDLVALHASRGHESPPSKVGQCSKYSKFHLARRPPCPVASPSSSPVRLPVSRPHWFMMWQETGLSAYSLLRLPYACWCMDADWTDADQVFMRMTVIIVDLVVYFPAVWIFFASMMSRTAPSITTAAAKSVRICKREGSPLSTARSSRSSTSWSGRTIRTRRGGGASSSRR